MSITIAGFVKNGVVVPNAPLPEGAKVEIRLNAESADECGSAGRPTPAQLRKMPREQRQAILAAAAEKAEADYRTDKELTGFEAYSEEDQDDNSSEG